LLKIKKLHLPRNLFVKYSKLIIMKKIYLLSVLLSMFLTQAQKTKQDEGVKIGIKGGLNVANFIGDVSNNAIRTGVHAGLVAEFVISDKFSIQPELLYSGQGFTNTGGVGFERSKFDYINLPVLAKFYLTKQLTLETGPQIGFLVSAKNRTNITNLTIGDQKTVDLGLNLGAGFELKNNVFFQARYNLGLSNINNSSNASVLRYSNSVIQFSVGYFF
jgi:Outer membrane protein beta-barrel domain